MAFSILILSLDFLAGPNEKDHQAKEAEGGENIKDVRHGLCVLRMAFCLWAGCLEKTLVVSEVERLPTGTELKQLVDTPHVLLRWFVVPV